MTVWTSEELSKIGAAEELQIKSSIPPASQN
jgi:hypothetical protein